MKKYEAMFIVKPDLSEEEKKVLFNQISDAVTKNQGTLTSANIWSEKRKLYFPLKKCREGVYYLVNFDVAPAAISELSNTYKLNENILRVLMIKLE